MNIVQLQSRLKGVPENTLIEYVQNPNGQVPSFLALSELTRRKELRAGAGQAPQMPTQTVADEVVSSSSPGIDNLPIREDMFQEESYANGGIVSFANGGTSFMPLSYNEFVRLLPAQQAKYVETYGKAPDRVQTTNPLQRAGVIGTPTTAMERLYAGQNPVSSLSNQDRATDLGAILPKDAMLPKTTLGKTSPAPMTSSAPAPAGIGSLPVAPVAPAQSVAPVAPAQSVDSMYEEPKDFSNNFDAMMQEEQTPQEKMAEMQGILGTDPARAKLQERLSKMEAASAKDAEKAPWMALAEAGLGIAAGSSPFALQNIAEGGKAGLKSLAEAKQRAVAAEEKQFEAANRLAQADRAEQVAAAKYGVESSEAQKAENRTTKLAKTSYQANQAAEAAKARLQSKQFNMEYKLKNKEIEAANARAEKQINATNAQNDRLQLQSQANLYTDIAKESNDAIKDLYVSLGNPLLGEEEKSALSGQIQAHATRRDAALKAMEKMATGNAAPTSGATKKYVPGKGLVPIN